MDFLNRIERRMGWLAFPGFLRYYAILHALAFGLQILRPGLSGALAFNRDLIMSGEVWRVVTFLFALSGPPQISPIFAAIFGFFFVMIAFMISDALEEAWGTFKTSLFYYVGILCLVGVNFLVGISLPGTTLMVFATAFFAFATLFPKTTFMLFLVIPVQVRFLAFLSGVALLAIAGGFSAKVGNPIVFALYLVLLLNYFLWAAIPALRGTAQVMASAQRRKGFEKKAMPADQAFHCCTVCSRTEISDPSLEFRVGTDGKEYCTEHLPDNR
jgi:hypothetical protein